MNFMKNNPWTGLVTLALLLVTATGCQKLKARDELNKGVASYRDAKYEEAIEHFKTAVELDPQLLNARLYLATAYANQYIPGIETDRNAQVGERAIEEFQKVSAADPNNIGSVSGIAGLYFQMKRMSDAKEYYKKWIQMEPTNAEAHYSVGVIDWTLTYQPRMVLKARLKLKPEDPIKDQKERQALTERNAPLIEEGMQMLNEAMELQPDYDDAMAYINLLYREKADLADTPDERTELLKTADTWIEKSLAIKKAKAEKEASKSQG